MTARLILTDSFDHWTGTNPHCKWTNVNIYGDLDFSSSYGRNGKGVRVSTGNYDGTNAGNDVALGNGSGMLEKIIPGFTSTDWSIGMAFRISDVIGFHKLPIMQTITSATTRYYVGTYYAAHVSLILTPKQRLVFCAGDWTNFPGGIISGYSKPLKRGIYYYLESRFVISATVGEVHLKIDGEPVLDATGINTLQGLASPDGIRIFHPKMYGWLFAQAVRDYDIDDVYIIADGNNLTDIKVESQIPTGTGALSSFTPSSGVNHVSMVNQRPSDGDTTYISATAAGNEDSFTFPNLAATAGSVHAVGVNAESRDDAASSPALYGLMRQGGVTYIFPTVTVNSSTYRGIYSGNTINPATSSQFTVSEVNGDEFGNGRSS